jgi:hypothetical protein
MKNFILCLILCASGIFQHLDLRAQTMSQFVGINTQPAFDASKAAKFSFVRDFHYFANDYGGSNNPPVTDCAYTFVPLRFNPSYYNATNLNYDDYLKKFSQRSSSVLHGCAPVMYGGTFDDLRSASKGICRNVDPAQPTQTFSNIPFHSLPDAYRVHTIWQSVFAARYGSGLPTGLAAAIQGTQIVNPTDAQNLGKGYVKYIEDFNEHDAAWRDMLPDPQLNSTNSADWGGTQNTEWFFRPKEYAAMLSANYDGHQNSPLFQIGNTNFHWGIKNMSPSTQVVMSGTADLRNNYINSVIDEFSLLSSKANRNGSLPFDIINMHFYPTVNHPAMTDGLYNAFLNGIRYFDINGNKGTFPEAANITLRERIAATLTGLHGGTTPVWLSEFGYDTGGNSFVETKVIGSFDKEWVQGQWITRGIMEYAAGNAISLNTRLKKVILYELQDDISRQSINPNKVQAYAYSGLLNGTAQPKRSWYHVRTFLNVLGNYSYTALPTEETPRPKFFTNIDPTTALGKDAPNPRIYRFVSGTTVTQPIFAVWKPTGNDEKFEGSLFIPNDLIGNINPSKILKIEVANLDENGARTIHTDFEKNIVVGNKTGVLIKNLKITETPLFLKFNGANDVSDITVPPVQTLTASTICCKSVELSWTRPPFTYANGTTVTAAPYSFYRVYYMKKSAFSGNLTDANAFYQNLPNMTLAIERLAGNVNSATITSLEEGVEYVFFVVPAIQISAYGGEILCNMTPMIAQKHFVIATAGGCTSAGSTACLLTPPTFSVVATPTAGGKQAMVEQMLGITETADTKCGNISKVVTGGWEIYNNDPASITCVTTFNEPQFLKAIYINHGTGDCRLKVEIWTDCCYDWQEITQLTFQQSERWYIISNNYINSKRIEKIRFTLYRGSEAGSIRRIYFCGSPAPDVCTGIPQVVSTSPPGVINNISASEIDTRSAKITWQAAKESPNQVNSPNLIRYIVRFGTSKNTAGEIVQPKEITREAEQNEDMPEILITELQPNTLYFVNIIPDINALPCPHRVSSNPQTPIEFTTLPEIIDPRFKQIPVQPSQELTFLPNPANDLMTVKFLEQPTAGNWTITNITGVQVKNGKFAKGQSTFDLDLTNYPSGVFIFTLIGEKYAPESKTFVVQH